MSSHISAMSEIFPYVMLTESKVIWRMITEVLRDDAHKPSFAVTADSLADKYYLWLSAESYEFLNRILALESLGTVSTTK